MTQFANDLANRDAGVRRSAGDEQLPSSPARLLKIRRDSGLLLADVLPWVVDAGHDRKNVDRDVNLARRRGDSAGAIRLRVSTPSVMTTTALRWGVPAA